MLLWKSWRDLRIAFFCGLGWLALLVAGVVYHALTSPSGSSGILASPDQGFQLISVFAGIQAFVFTLVAFGMGTRGVGHDIGGGSGSFLLTRPVARDSYVWTEWFSGILALAVLVSLAAAWLWFSIHFHAIRVSSYTGSGNVTTSQTWSLPSLPIGIAAVEFLCVLLFVALVFGVTQLGTVAFRHSTAGLLFSLGFFIGWLVVMEILRHNYPSMGPHIPNLLLRPFGPIDGDMRLIPHVTASILERLAILPLFPLAAQFLLRRTEV